MYNIKNAEFTWRGIPISGFADTKYDISQNGDSFTPYKGIAGEGLNIANNQRMWNIVTSLKVDSTSLPILEEDNDKRTEGELVIRDLNTGISDVYTKCAVLNIAGKKDSDPRTITWSALYKNGK